MASDLDEQPARDTTAAPSQLPVRIPRIFALAFLIVSLTHCQTIDEISRVHLSQTPEGRELLAHYDRYAGIADKLKTYHDDGSLDGSEVLDVLIDAGVIEPAPKQKSPANRPGKPKKSRGGAPSPESGSASGWVWPMKAGLVSSEFGRRSGRPHEGMDIAADRGEPIYAASAGTVIYADDRMSGYGNALILRHADSTTTLYAHATRLLVAEGATISRGGRIATVGTTGRVTGPHLHFEVRVGETAIDPRDVLPRQPF